MSNLPQASSSRAIAKFYPWILLTVGAVFVIVQPSYWFGWAYLNLFLLYPICFLTTIPHELGHAIAVRCLQVKLVKIVIGSGKTFITFKFLDFFWELKRIPVGGRTLFYQKSTRFYRLKLFLILLAGPLTNFLLILLALQFSQEIILKKLPGTYLFPGIVFYTANALMFIGNLLPYQTGIDGIKLSSDGLQMLTAVFLSKQKIAERVALSHILDGRDWASRNNYEKAIESFSEAIQKNRACAQAYQERGSAYKALSDYQKAVENFNQAIKLKPQEAMSYAGRGLTYYHWRKIDSAKLHKAIEDFNQAIHLKPNIEFFYLMRATSHYYIGEEGEHLKVVKRVKIQIDH